MTLLFDGPPSHRYVETQLCPRSAISEMLDVPLSCSRSHEIQVNSTPAIDPTCTAFLRARIPLNKLSCFADVLEENAFSLGGRRTTSDLIPFVLQNEKQLIKSEISRQAVSVIFDGTTRLGEAMCVILHYVDDR